MVLRRCLLAAWVLLTLLVSLRGSARPAPRGEREEELLARLQRERNPVKKAKYEIRLGRLKLLQAQDAYGQGNVDQGAQRLAAYLERVKNSWETLRSSGRKAVRQPQGFKELDIALREDLRTLDDLAHRVAFMDRDPIVKTSQEVEKVRGEVLKALFPAERPTGSGKHPAEQTGHNFLPERP